MILNFSTNKKILHLLICIALPIIICSKLSSQSYDINGGGVKFEFKYQKGDSYRILSTVNEDVFFNGELDHKATIVNRVSAEITETFDDGSGVLDCIYMTTEDSTRTSTGSKFNWGEEYHSIFKRSKLGIYDISDIYFMPMVRDVPTFLDKEIMPGDSWTANGYEAHDLRRIFNLDKPYKVPFTATYKYHGTIKQNGTTLDVISVKYSMYMETPENNLGVGNQYEDWPTLMMGFSDELIYWNREKGAIDHYTESFRIVLETAYGNIFEFKGNAHAEVTDIVHTSTEDNVKSVQNAVDKLGLDNVTVKQSERGLVISIENIKFKADSSELLEEEKQKLLKIAGILKNYPDNDILVTGHTALAGTEKSRKTLSEQRAQEVADYLINLGVKDNYHIFTQGLGATQPIAPNDNEANKAKNRRVEITIMDK